MSIQRGFGQLCYVEDQLIPVINRHIKKQNEVLPQAVELLKQSLPAAAFRQYFPKFAAGNATGFDINMYDVGNCGSVNSKCADIPQAVPFNDTANGQRQLYLFGPSLGVNYDIRAPCLQAEEYYYVFMDVLKQNNYCSLYNY